jgi:hypothetical protein
MRLMSSSSRRSSGKRWHPRSSRVRSRRCTHSRAPGSHRSRSTPRRLHLRPLHPRAAQRERRPITERNRVVPCHRTEQDRIADSVLMGCQRDRDQAAAQIDCSVPAEELPPRTGQLRQIEASVRLGLELLARDLILRRRTALDGGAWHVAEQRKRGGCVSCRLNSPVAQAGLPSVQ